MKTRKIPTPRLWRGLSHHPYSELVEFGVGIDIDQLTSHMQQHGYDPDEPIVIFDGKILDGRHKQKAANDAEVEPTFREFVGTQEEAIEFVRKKVLRQHLDTSQRAMIAAKMATLKAGMNQHSEEVLQNCSTSTAEAAESMNVSERSVHQAQVVEQHGSASLKRAVRVGRIAVSDAAKVAQFPVSVQNEALELVNAKTVDTIADAMKEMKLSERPNTKGKKRKRVPEPSDNGMPKSVNNALADTWHLDSARQLSALAKQCKSAFSWSVFLDPAILDHLKSAEEYFLSAAPRKVCPDCKGQKKIEKENCTTCRASGYVASQIC